MYKLVQSLRRQLTGWNARTTQRQLKEIGDCCELHTSVGFIEPQRIKIGNYVYVGPQTQLYGLGGLTIEDHVVIGPEVVILTSLHNFRNARLVPYDEYELLRPVLIGAACWLGMRALILPGVRLGAGCVVGAGAVVTKSFSEGCILGGNPAIEIGKRDMSAFWKLYHNKQTYLRVKKMETLKKIEKNESDRH